ncbi:MAG TPA: D-aminoacylase [Gemmatimonadaceae bacterium]|nr:D-aminoacylase [Gemmatimonadaceae bacterium]
MTSSRRSFLTGAAAAAASFALGARPVKSHGRRAAHDLVIRGGTVFDGTGAPGREADVAISGTRIAQIAAKIAERGTEEIDARGSAVAPGFIDIHSHGDSSLSADPRLESLVRQGITTIVVGQDGSSQATGASRGPSDEDRGYDSFTALFKSIDSAQPSVNIASMIGLGSVRGTIVGANNRPATASELQRMTALVERALAEGACGASSGLEYTPGAFASQAELIALCKPLAARGLPYATHMRNEDDRLLDSIDESIAVARGARCPLQISHLKTQGPRNWSKLDTVFQRIDAARKEGLDVAFDRYPYIAYQTGLTNLFPVWSRDGGTAAFLARLDSGSVAPRIKAETLAKVELIGGWDNVQVSGVGSDEDRAAEGERLGRYAQSLGKDPYDVAVALLQRNRGSVNMVGFAMSEENLERILAHPLGMVCSDGGAFAIEGPARRGFPHPRGLGTFPRVLGKYVRERKALTLPQAISKMSAFPASRVQLRDRGRLTRGLAADVVVFDPARIIDRATFDQPFQYPDGIACVVLNGAIQLRDGQRMDKRAGRALRPMT